MALVLLSWASLPAGAKPQAGWYAAFHGALAISPDGKLVAVAASDQERGAAVWDVATGKLVAALPGQAVTSVAFSPDGKWVATGRMGDIVTVWEARTGRVHRKMTTGRKAESYRLPAGRKPQLGGLMVCFSGDGRCLYTVAGGMDGPSAVMDEKFRVWDLETGNQIRTLLNPGRALFSSDGRYIVSSDLPGRKSRTKLLDAAGLELFSVEDMEPLGFLSDDETLLLKKGAAIVSLHLPSRSEKPILKATKSFTGITRSGFLMTFEGELYDLTGGLRGRVTASYPGYLTSSPDGKWLLAYGFTEAILWDITNNRTRHRYERGFADADFTPDGSSLIGTSYDGKIRVLNISTLKERSWSNQPPR